MHPFIRSYRGSGPILLEMPHSGRLGLETLNNVPKVLASKVRFVSEAVRRTIGFGCDSAVPDLSGFINLVSVSRLSGISNDLARVYCDTNRGRNEVSGLALEGRPMNEHQNGVIWARTVPTGLDLTRSIEELEHIVNTQCEPILNKPLSAIEFEELMGQVYDPYHAEICAHQQRIIDQHGFFIHLALHTLPPLSPAKIHGGYVCGQKATRGPYDPEHNTLPDVILIHNGFDEKTMSADKVLIDRVRYAFESAGLIVESGIGPFLGNIGVTKLYGNPARGRNIIGIEHVTHDIEPKRHLGNPFVDTKKAMALRPVYAKVIEYLLQE